MELKYIDQSFIKDEIKLYGFNEDEKNLYLACREATNCTFIASEIVAKQKYNEYITLIDSYIELADILTYRLNEEEKLDNAFIKGLKFFLNNIRVIKGVYEPTKLQEARIKTYLNSYGWIVNENRGLAINLDIDYIDFNNRYLA